MLLSHEFGMGEHHRPAISFSSPNTANRSYVGKWLYESGSCFGVSATGMRSRFSRVMSVPTAFICFWVFPQSVLKKPQVVQ